MGLYEQKLFRLQILKHFLNFDFLNISKEVLITSKSSSPLVFELKISNPVCLITGDLYIDCTGFKKLLMNNLNNKWISKSTVQQQIKFYGKCNYSEYLKKILY